MFFIPFIFFLLLTVHWWRTHKGLDLCTYMSGLYALTTFLGIVIVLSDLTDAGGILFDRYDLELNALPTVIFCITIAIGILPFSLIHSREIRTISNNSPRLVTIISCLLIGVALLNFWLVADSTAEILGGDLETVRRAHYEGIETPAEAKAQTLPSILGYLYYLKLSTLIALPLFFYYACFTQRNKIFTGLLFFASLTTPISALQAADRTEFILYSLMFLCCVIFFWKNMSRKFKRKMFIIGSPIALIIAIYIIAVSAARFGDRDEGTQGGIIQYAGQNYLNFCYFWENARYDEICSEREFPMINHFVMKIDSNNTRRNERSGRQGFFISVFASYVGDIMLDLSPVGMVIWIFFYFLINMLIIKRRRREEFDIGEILAIFVSAVIPIFGIFYYKYAFWHYTLMFLMVFIVYFSSGLSNKLQPTGYEDDGEETA
ncbi:MAG: oligosaccharide repeat unit polymerase [Prevotella sp.]|uniref:oligosaccharide repeat unit polymerase n=1 Tax=Prevotella sp. TaxID=59823 RepID=UPI002A2C2375|nr:oligosaccharide repeat unit polymerase [Prevotella sp.]MDD7318615.1 oligosaccharide repeat unit polymerase [Prevotellaceae bacterium]MDY4019429.1 oligosaccharide repeat unit polymerase [Prevotella sp.]